MDKLIMTTIIIGVIAIIAFVAFSLVQANLASNAEEPVSEASSYQTCGNRCTANNNCEISTCQARTGRTCGCKAT